MATAVSLAKKGTPEYSTPQANDLFAPASIGAKEVSSRIATYGCFAEQLGHLRLAYLHAVEGQLPQTNAASEFDFKAFHRFFGGSYIANS